MRRTRPKKFTQDLIKTVFAGSSAILLIGASLPSARAQIGGLPSVPGIQPLAITQVPPAQQNGEEGPVSVLGRTHPEYAPVPFVLRGFDVYPSGFEIGTYDANIFATRTNPSSDFILRTRPNLHVDNGRGPNAVTGQLDIYAEDDRYVGHANLSNENAGGSLQLSDDFGQGLTGRARSSFVYQHQDPAGLTTNTAGGALRALPAYTSFTQEFGIDREFQPFGLIVDGIYTRQDYQNVVLADGTVANQTQLNANIFQLGPKFAYAVAPDLRPFVQINYARYLYDNGILSANEIGAVSGADFDIRRLIRGTVFFGYKEHLYDASTIPTARGPTFGINVNWFATERLTLSSAGSQTFYDSTTTTLNGVHSTINSNQIEMQADFEALQNLILVAVSSYENDDFHEIRRTDNIYSAGVGAQYLISPNVSMLTQYQFSSRISNQSLSNYTRNTLSLGLKVSF